MQRGIGSVPALQYRQNAQIVFVGVGSECGVRGVERGGRLLGDFWQ